jgi:hypothetical protein
VGNYSGPYLDGADVRVLRSVLVLVEAVLGELALSQINAQLDEQDHHRLERGDGAVAGALGGDMLVEELQGSLLLLDADEFLGAFAAAALAGEEWRVTGGRRRNVQRVLGLAVGWRRHDGRLGGFEFESRGSKSQEGGLSSVAWPS